MNFRYPYSSKCCCNRCNSSFVDNHYAHIITGASILLIMRGFVNSYPKARSIKNQNKFVLRKLQIKITNCIDQFIEIISNGKSIHNNQFSEWKGHVMPSVDEKNHTLKNNRKNSVKFVKIGKIRFHRR